MDFNATMFDGGNSVTASQACALNSVGRIVFCTMVVCMSANASECNVHTFGSIFSFCACSIQHGGNLPCPMQANLGRAQHELAALLAMAARFPGYLAPLQPAAQMLVGARNVAGSGFTNHT